MQWNRRLLKDKATKPRSKKNQKTRLEKAAKSKIKLKNPEFRLSIASLSPYKFFDPSFSPYSMKQRLFYISVS